MKRLLKVFIFSICFFRVSAQVQLGVKGGLNLANIPYDNPIATGKNLVAFHAGVFADYPVFKHVNVQMELVYSVQGGTEIYHVTTGDSKITSRFNYLNIPLLLSYTHRSGVFVESGLQLGVFLNGYTDYGAFEQSSKDNVRTCDWAWVIGLGYKLPKLNLGFDARYNLGFSNISYYDPSIAPVQNNRVFQMGLFYTFL